MLSEAQLEAAQRELRDTGRLHLRRADIGKHIDSPVEFANLVIQLWGGLPTAKSYKFGSTTRKQLHENGTLAVNQEPPEAAVVQHSEMTYNDAFPRYICFYADLAAPVGGKTLISNVLKTTLDLEQEYPLFFERLKAEVRLKCRG